MSTEAPYLLRGPEGLMLTDGNLSLVADFRDMLPRVRRGNLQKEFLVRASGVRKAGESPAAVDATAGLGEDSFILAACGFRVTMYEYNPVIAELLQDALLRAALDPDLRDIASRMTLKKGDSIQGIRSGEESPYMVLLDPMFPERRKSAMVKKKFQLLQKLEKPCSSGEELLAAAMTAQPKRIVIKRPLKGPFLGGLKPDISIEGKMIRYDCLIL